MYINYKLHILKVDIMLYKILTKKVITNIKLKLKLFPLLLFYHIFCIWKVTTILKYKCINNLFEKTTIQTCLYLLSFWWFFLWIHVSNGIVNIFKFSIHFIIVFILRINNIRNSLIRGSALLYLEWYIQHPKIITALLTLPEVSISWTNIKLSLMSFKISSPPVFFSFNHIITKMMISLFPNTICNNFIGKLDPIQIRGSGPIFATF